MRQAAEAQVVNPQFELGEQGLRQVLCDVIEEVRRSIHQDIDGSLILHELLNASWLQSLLKAYERLQRHLRDSPPPVLDHASGLSLQLLVDIGSTPSCSEEARELQRLLRQPHLQALLSAHDTVAQKDYEPVLPPVPEDLAEDEEATRIVCLVKNKQPLLRSAVAPPHLERSRGGAWPCPPHPCKPVSGCRAATQCRTNLRYTNMLGEQRLNQSAPSLYSSVWIDNIIELDRDASSSPGSRRWTRCRPCLACCSNLEDCFHPGPPSGLRSQGPHVHTAPPSPMRPLRVLEEDSLDQLRTSVQRAASSMESSTRDIRLLGEKMAVATERMTETVQDNSQALVLLTEVVDRLQKVLEATSLKPPDPDPCAPQQPRCSCTSSSTSSLEAPATSQAAVRLSGLGPGSAQARLQQKEQNHASASGGRLLTNGVQDQDQPEEPRAATGGCQNQRRRRERRRRERGDPAADWAPP